MVSERTGDIIEIALRPNNGLTSDRIGVSAEFVVKLTPVRSEISRVDYRNSPLARVGSLGPRTLVFWTGRLANRSTQADSHGSEYNSLSPNFGFRYRSTPAHRNRTESDCPSIRMFDNSGGEPHLSEAEQRDRTIPNDSGSFLTSSPMPLPKLLGRCSLKYRSAPNCRDDILTLARD